MPARTILEIKNLSSDSAKLYEVLNSERDLSAILVAGSFIDACLGSILNIRLRKSSVTDKLLDTRGGAIGSFSARADLCYVLGLINKDMYKDLITISGIRNVVAHHHMEIDFNDPEIQKLCGKLNYVKTLKNGNENEPLIVGDWVDTPRNQFMLAVVMISNRLLLIGLGLKRENFDV